MTLTTQEAFVALELARKEYDDALAAEEQTKKNNLALTLEQARTRGWLSPEQAPDGNYKVYVVTKDYNGIARVSESKHEGNQFVSWYPGSHNETGCWTSFTPVAWQPKPPLPVYP